MKSFSFNAQVITAGSLATANVEFSVTHGLGRTPLAVFVLSQNTAAVVYKGTTAWTSTLLYLRTSVATTILKLLVM